MADPHHDGAVVLTVLVTLRSRMLKAVAEVKTDRVKLAMGDEAEELVLRVATNPRVTPQPAVAVAPAPPPRAARDPGSGPRRIARSDELKEA